MTRPYLPLIALLATVLTLTAADPPTKPAVDKPAVAKKAKAKLPTTKEEFEALAKEGPKPPWLPFGRNHITVIERRITGTVVSVSADAIEVLPRGKKEAVKLPPHELLATGAVCHWESDPKCYLLDDVQKGDVVVVAYNTVDETIGDECFHVSILRRPGGVVPPSRKPAKKNPHHTGMQAIIDSYEKGTPLPDGDVMPPASFMALLFDETEKKDDPPKKKDDKK